MKRVIVLGGLGMFGRMAVEQLRQFGVPALTASRATSADLMVNANEASSIRSVLQANDLILDAAGPFQARSAALVEAAIDVGFDVIDLNDSLQYAERVLALEPRITAAGIRVLSAASTVSAVAASVVRLSGIQAPRCVTAFLAPATRYTANAGTALSLLDSVGRPVRVWRDGRMQQRPGWSEPRRFPLPTPIGPVCGRLMESADALHLPRIWPTLCDVTMHVDANVAGTNLALRAVAAIPGLRGVLGRHVDLAVRIARKFGAAAGGIGYEVEDDSGRMLRYAIVGRGNSQLVAVAPAVLAARAIVDGQFEHHGLVPPDRHVEPSALIEFLQTNGITFSELK